MIREPIHERTARLRAIPSIRNLRLKSYSVDTKVVDRHGYLVVTKVSLSTVARAEAQLIDDLNPRGSWRQRREPSDGISVTAILMGDPSPERSALYERGRG